MPTPSPLLLSLLLPLLGLGAGVAEPASEPPESPPIEVVRITRDFGMPHYDLALDAFAEPGETRLRDVRLHWVNTSADDSRKPLGPLTERMVKVNLHRENDRAVKVTVTGDRKEFAFALELHEGGAIDVYVAAITDDGQALPRCRVTRARLIARRVLGIAAGLDHIAVECAEASGRPAQIEHREL